MKDVLYIDRNSKQVCTEEIYGRRALSLLYGNSIGSRLFAFFFLPLIARLPILSRLYGWLQKREQSRKKIGQFIATYRIDVSEFAEPVESFRSFNEFFIRRLRSDCRPVDPRENTAIMPADGRYLVIPNLLHARGFYVKGQHFDVDRLLQGQELAWRYHDGAMAIARLNPTDYHRFHFPVDGVPWPPQVLGRTLFSVNPVALSKRLSILWENRRVLTSIASERFGEVLMVEVGATCVGTIHQTHVPGQFRQKGDEKGYFSFGGSCIVLLFEKNRIVFDEDLVTNSSQGLETKGRFGMTIGHQM